MWSHSLSVSITKPKSSYQFHLCLELFVLLFLLFQVQTLDHHHGITIIMIFTIASSLGIVLPISWSLRWTMLALRVSSIYQNQTRAFNYTDHPLLNRRFASHKHLDKVCKIHILHPRRTCLTLHHWKSRSLLFHRQCHITPLMAHLALSHPVIRSLWRVLRNPYLHCKT